MNVRLIVPLLWSILVCSCISRLDYDISGVDSQIVLNALWSAGDSEHDVYLCSSGAYSVHKLEGPVQISCFVNGEMVAYSDSASGEVSSNGIVFMRYTLSASFAGGDEVKLTVRAGDTELKSITSVPRAPSARVDTSSVDISNYPDQIMRDYSFRLILEDSSEEQSYYRLLAPSLKGQVRTIGAGTLIGTNEWSYLPINEDEPVFNNIPMHFPEEITRELPFLGTAVTNGTHVFSDELFSGRTYVFNFSLNQGSYADGLQTGCYMDYRIRFRLASLSREEYMFLLAVNASASSLADPMSEPATMPCNIEGGLGFFGIDNVFETSLKLNRQIWPDNNSF